MINKMAPNTKRLYFKNIFPMFTSYPKITSLTLSVSVLKASSFNVDPVRVMTSSE